MTSVHALALILLDDFFPEPFVLTKSLQSRIHDLASFLSADKDEIYSISLYPKQASNNIFFYVHYWDAESFLDKEQNVIFTEELYSIFLHNPSIPSNEQ